MKNLLACLVAFAAFSVSAQQFSPTWNPDADDNGSIGATDVLATLSVYGNNWGVNTNLTCDYLPSDSEQWFVDVLSGNVVIDSLVFQQIQLSIAEVYVLGCPEPVGDTVLIEQTTLLYPETSNIDDVNPYVYFQSLYDDDYAECQFSWSAGVYSFSLYALPNNYETLGDMGFPFESWFEFQSTLPFGDFDVSNSGIEGEIWNVSNQVQFIQLLPYWHYAE